MLPPARAGVGSAVNDATRELGGTLGVAVVGSLFASVYADHLADGAFGRLPGAALAQAQDSVGAALAISGGSPRLLVAMQDAFMSGLSVSCMVIGTLCLVGALGALFFLPGPGASHSRGVRASWPRSSRSPPDGPEGCSRVCRMAQRTLVLLKPDAVRRGLVGNILSRFESKGLDVVALELRHIDAAQADAHYAEHVDRDFYPPLRDFVTSGPLIAAVLEGDEAIEVVRAINGATDGRKAAPGTIRGDLSLSNRENLVHGSDGEESAAREITPAPELAASR